MPLTCLSLVTYWSTGVLHASDCLASVIRASVVSWVLGGSSPAGDSTRASVARQAFSAAARTSP